jgi:hypothetical protein
MKIKIISELFSVVVTGVLYGLWSNEMYLKWHRLGREAFMAHQSQRFDKFYANPHSSMLWILVYLVFTMLVFALYKGIAFVVAKVLSTIANKSGTAQE